MSLWSPEMLRRLKILAKAGRYIIRCDTCGLELLNLSVEEFLQLIQEGKWHSSHPAYIAAGYHWVDNVDHWINAYLKMKSGEELHIFDLTQSWKLGLQVEPDQTKQAMKNELKHLESRRTENGKQRME